MFKKLGVKITLIATFIVTLYAFLTKVNFIKASYAIIFTIIIFYILGGFIEIKLKNYMKENKENALTDEEENITDNDEENNDENNKNNEDEEMFIDKNEDFDEQLQNSK